MKISIADAIVSHAADLHLRNSTFPLVTFIKGRECSVLDVRSVIVPTMFSLQTTSSALQRDKNTVFVSSEYRGWPCVQGSRGRISSSSTYIKIRESVRLPGEFRASRIPTRQHRRNENTWREGKRQNTPRPPTRARGHARTYTLALAHTRPGFLWSDQ